jgi:hypothetical protein
MYAEHDLYKVQTKIRKIILQKNHDLFYIVSFMQGSRKNNFTIIPFSERKGYMAKIRSKNS